MTFSDLEVGDLMRERDQSWLIVKIKKEPLRVLVTWLHLETVNLPLVVYPADQLVNDSGLWHQIHAQVYRHGQLICDPIESV